MKVIKRTAFLFVFLLPLFSAPSFAGCETASSANPPVAELAQTDVMNINKFIEQEINFIEQDLGNTATFEMMERLIEFDELFIRPWLSSWWNARFLPALKKMTQQLSASQEDQTRAMGAAFDAHLLDETLLQKNIHQEESRRRYALSETSCQLDTAGPGLLKARRMSQALSKAFASEDMPRRSNTRGSPSASGRAAEMAVHWQEYKDYFCDTAAEGCAVPGVLAGQNRDIPSLLWGERQTLDLAPEQERKKIAASLRYMISPLMPDPVSPGAVESVNGHQVLLARRARDARMGTVYNAMGALLAERAGGSGVNTQSLRIAAGIPPENASVNASYREIQEALIRDRYNNPEYVVRLIENPYQLQREQGVLGALGMQTWSDIYRRSEEMLVMEAASFSHSLDMQMPSSALAVTPLK